MALCFAVNSSRWRSCKTAHSPSLSSLAVVIVVVIPPEALARGRAAEAVGWRGRARPAPVPARRRAATAKPPVVAARRWAAPPLVAPHFGGSVAAQGAAEEVRASGREQEAKAAHPGE